MDSAKRESILEAAGRCFARLGFKKASIDQIAQLAGVAKGTVYLACDSKEELFYQAVLRDLRSWIARLARLIDPRTPADRLLEQVAVSSIEYFESHTLVRSLFLGAAYGELPAWVARLDELRVLGLANLKEILKLGIRQGVFRADLEIEDTSVMLHDMQLATYVMQSRRGELDTDELLRRVRLGVRLVLDGMRPRPEPGPA